MSLPTQRPYGAEYSLDWGISTFYLPLFFAQERRLSCGGIQRATFDISLKTRIFLRRLQCTELSGEESSLKNSEDFFSELHVSALLCSSHID